MKRVLSLFFLSGCVLSIANLTAFAAAPDRVATSADKTWASSGTPAVSTLVSQAQSGNNLDVNGKAVTVKNDGTANDGGGLNTFTIGDITDSGSGSFSTTTSSANDLTVNIGSVDIGDVFTVTNINNNDAGNATTVTNDFSIGGNLNLFNIDDDSDVDISLAVGGDFTVGGVAWLMASTGSTGADATLTLSGATNDLGSGLTFFDSGAGRAILTLDGTSDQTVAGLIDGGSDNNGTMNLNGTANMTFTGNIGNTHSLRAINIAAAVTKTAEFDGTVAVTTITLSGAGKAQFDGSVTATALNITSTGEAEINASSGITTTTFLGAGTLDLNESLTGDIDFGLGGDGLVTLLGGKNITGNVDNSSGSDGVGTLTIETGGNSTISGTVGASNTLKAVNVQSGSGNTAT
ncbi:MAG: hypothetical protein PHE97_07490 [Candidatus Omnitrophica bacterium]|nr:hypothetical protein [Candidatus Omnitrophota bacterium]